MAKSKDEYVAFLRQCLKDVGQNRAKVYEMLQKRDVERQFEPLSFGTFKRYYLEAKEMHIAFLANKQAELDEQDVKDTLGAIKEGLKSKHDWVRQLQKELDDDEVEVTIWDYVAAKSVTYTRKMTPAERKGHVDRISKMMGYEASIKQEIAVTDKTIAVNYTD